MSEYLIINILIVIVPLIMSFEKKIKFYKKFNQVAISIMLVGIPFLIWDSIAISRGDWMFNHKYIIGINFFNLPIEEILFFITVPYSIIFLYETFIYYLKGKPSKFKNAYLVGLSPVLILTGFIFFQQNYTFTVFIFLAIIFSLIGFSKLNFIRNKNFIYFILISFIPFLIVNYFLTSLPILVYNPSAIWGERFLTIPLEDFVYSVSLVLSYLFTYELAKEKWLRKSAL